MKAANPSLHSRVTRYLLIGGFAVALLFVVLEGYLVARFVRQANRHSEIGIELSDLESKHEEVDRQEAAERAARPRRFLDRIERRMIDARRDAVGDANKSTEPSFYMQHRALQERADQLLFERSQIDASVAALLRMGARGLVVGAFGAGLIVAGSIVALRNRRRSGSAMDVESLVS